MVCAQKLPRRTRRDEPEINRPECIGGRGDRYTRRARYWGAELFLAGNSFRIDGHGRGWGRDRDHFRSAEQQQELTEFAR